MIESVGGYRARLYRIYLYLKFATRIRKAIFAARGLALQNLDGSAHSFDRVLKRDQELAVCLFLIYAAVPVAALKLGNASQMLEAAADNLQNLLKFSAAPIISIRPV